MMFLADMVFNTPVLEGKAFIIDGLWSQILTVASSCVVLSAPLTWSYPGESWCFALMLVRDHVMPVCVVLMSLDLLLDSWIYCPHDINLPGNPYLCAGQIWLVASSGSLSCLGRYIEWFFCSSPSWWLWLNMCVCWWSKNPYVVVVLDGASEFMIEW